MRSQGFLYKTRQNKQWTGSIFIFILCFCFWWVVVCFYLIPHPPTTFPIPTPPPPAPPLLCHHPLYCYYLPFPTPPCLPMPMYNDHSRLDWVQVRILLLPALLVLSCCCVWSSCITAVVRRIIITFEESCPCKWTGSTDHDLGRCAAYPMRKRYRAGYFCLQPRPCCFNDC